METTDGQNKAASAAINQWVKVVAKMDGSIEVQTPNINLGNAKNLAAVLDLLAAGISALCHNRLYRLGEESRIIPAKLVPKVQVKH